MRTMLTVILALLAPVTAKAEFQRVKASFYWQFKKTANGESFDPNSSTAAHRTLPFGTMVEVRNPANGRREIVRINNRGPFIKGRHLDVARGVAQRLDFVKQGVAPLEIRVVSRRKR